ncbi:hypothetical protein BBR47_39340 [Brevibacillus brevis NBRC 100599]|uniref:Uncharacterized protein n=1 Tax=Brevibacillus brevis (strain 47 / JCM 6285 / NBRC 100599) TaxID=358681 RepID=C0ZGK2_BREBN|nr:hypothetical protein BBR47_39340 [Brevibacillus brevis NBRC 100599]
MGTHGILIPSMAFLVLYHKKGEKTIRNRLFTALKSESLSF